MNYTSPLLNSHTVMLSAPRWQEPASPPHGGSRLMRAAVNRSVGGPEVVSVDPKWPKPFPKHGEVLVQVEACALNYADIFVREGLAFGSSRLPSISGSDVAGVVASVGEDVQGLQAGDRVLVNPLRGCTSCEDCQDGFVYSCPEKQMLGATLDGGLAEFVAWPAEKVVRVPDGFPLELAACLPVVYSAAYRMLVTKAHAKGGDNVLVVGVGGGLGVAAVQLAKAVGARVIAAVSSEEKGRRALRLGADEALNYTDTPDWDSTVRRLTQGGADVVIDCVGRTTLSASLGALKKRGRLITCAATSGPVAAVDLRSVFENERTVHGSNGWTHEEFCQVIDLAFTGKFVPVMDRVLPLDRVGDGERLLEERRTFGKIVISLAAGGRDRDSRHAAS
jgi:alcohol dehydrogenase